MAAPTPPPLLLPGPPYPNPPDPGLVPPAGKAGQGGGIPQSTIDNYPSVQQAQQYLEVASIEADNPILAGQINGVLGGLPVAEKNQEYFAVVFEAMDTSPEIIDQTQFKVIYLCDSLLNVSKPAQDTIAVKNITQNFERQKIATVRVDQGTVLNQQLAGNHQITAVGSLQPIIGTQLGKGPFDYSTTMSFQLQGQLGYTSAVEVANYRYKMDHSSGVRNLPLSAKVEDSITIPDSSGNPIGAWTKDTVISASSESPARLNFNAIALPTGSGSEAFTEVTADTNPSSAQLTTLGYTVDENYINGVKLLTGSLEGYSRIKVKSRAVVGVLSSSIADLFLSTNNEYSSFFVNATQKIYKSGSSGITLLASNNAPVNTQNTSLAGTAGGVIIPGSTAFNLNKFSQGLYSDIDGFDWTIRGFGHPNQNTTNPSNTTINTETDYFDFEEGDVVYSTLHFADTEVTSSNYLAYQFYPLGEDGPIEWTGHYYTQSLATYSSYVDAPITRTYNFFTGRFEIFQETPAGDSLFINGVSGVTASYYTTQSSGFVSQSFYNYTSSYWIGATNTTSSITSQSICILTASSDLTNFYGGDYIQIDPGLEPYNLFNANGEVSTPLYADNNINNPKKTWDSFGFNPIKEPFIPIIGDFIRFEYSKNKVFQIIGVDSVTTPNNLKITLDNHVPISTVLDNFVIYRIVEDGQYIILDVKKNNEAGVNQAFSGFITAKYKSENLEARSDGLIFDLKQAGIIAEGAYLSRRGYTSQ